uniref:Cuticular protein 25 n=1 Tax=Leptinotarsa decemlineata TaxID=7539 RepID=A0A3Q8HFR0_LEPDE|nr:cuticular protein 25 [Leptinotarsa decemlineata]
MFKLVLFFCLAAIAFGAEDPATTFPTTTSPFTRDFLRNQLFQNPNNPYTGNKVYLPNNYKYNQPKYFDKDYQKKNPVDYYNKEYLNKNYYNNEYYQKYNQEAKSAGIVRSESDINPDGSYQYSFETQNGIAAEQQGTVRATADKTESVVVQGFYRYFTPDGTPVEVKYTADEFGYHPQASVLSNQGRAATYKADVTPKPADE